MVAPCDEEKVMQTPSLSGRESEPGVVLAPPSRTDTADTILKAFDREFQCLILADSECGDGKGIAGAVSNGTLSRMNEDRQGVQGTIAQVTGSTDCEEGGRAISEKGVSLGVVRVDDNLSEEGATEVAFTERPEIAARSEEGTEKAVIGKEDEITQLDKRQSDGVEVIDTGKKEQGEENEVVMVMKDNGNDVAKLECGEERRDEKEGGHDNRETALEKSEINDQQNGDLEEAQKEAEVVNENEGDAKNKQDIDEEAPSSTKKGTAGEKNETHYCSLPQRSNAPDCAYYLKTGKCAYGLNCRFNHPLKAVQNENIVYQVKNTVESTELNFMGLPLRPGEKECPFYMRNGLCKFSVNCRFHHPDPTTASGPNSPSVYSGAYGLSRPGTLQLPVRPHPVPEAYHNHAPRPNIPSYAPWMCQPPQLANHSPARNGNQHFSPSFAPSRHSAPVSNSSYGTNNYNYQRANPPTDFPQRYGEPDCQYYMKTGDCKYRSACKFNHPKNRLQDPSKSPNIYLPKEVRPQDPHSSGPLLNPFGLPLRPGQIVCNTYKYQGICKYGPSCKFDHPTSIPAGPEGIKPRGQTGQSCN